MGLLMGFVVGFIIMLLVGLLVRCVVGFVFIGMFLVGHLLFLRGASFYQKIKSQPVATYRNLFEYIVS